MFLIFFFFNDTATTEIYTLSLHDALPISDRAVGHHVRERAAVDLMVRAEVVGLEREDPVVGAEAEEGERGQRHVDRKSTRLNSSHANISYAVFCLKKKTNTPKRYE